MAKIPWLPLENLSRVNIEWKQSAMNVSLNKYGDFLGKSQNEDRKSQTLLSIHDSNR